MGDSESGSAQSKKFKSQTVLISEAFEVFIVISDSKSIHLALVRTASFNNV